MHIPKKYLRDKSVLSLLGVNAALFILTAAYVISNVDPGLSTTSIISYRSSQTIRQIPGPTNDLYQFAIFAFIVSLVSILLSIRLYSHRRYLAVGMLSLNIVSLLFCFAWFYHLTRTL